MVFLNLFLVGGLAAVSAPIVIHLLHRSKVLPHDWGAMMFLEELLAERARRLRMHELLLLLVRAMLVGCLALALMRPVLKWTSSSVRSPGVHTSAVILLDDSYSMNAGRPRSAWLEAREQALRYVDTLRRGDDATVFFTSSAGKGPAPAQLFDLERIREIVRGAAPRHAACDMPRALTVALQHLETLHNPHRELIVFSDMQAAGWELADGARWSFLGSAVRASRVRPNIVLAAVGERVPPNAALTGLSASRALVDCYSPVTFNFTLANTGPEPARGVAVTFCVDGAPKTTRTVDLPLHGKEVLAFEHKFERAGSHYIGCRLRYAQDALDDDDELLHSVVVIDQLPVLIVDGDRREQPLASESGFLRLALSPRDSDDPAWRSVIEPTVIESSDLRFTELSRYRVVVLANVAALPGTVVSELERFVVAGGGLLVTLGDRVQMESYNRDLYRQGGGLLPVALERLHGARTVVAPPARLVSDDGGARSETVSLGSIVTDAPALELFRPEKGQDWSRARIRAWFGVAPPGAKEDIRTLASYSNGAPALVQKKLGEGRVILFSTAVDMDWSDLPVQPLYVPLMQNLVLDLASAVIPPRNLRVGQVLTHIAAGEAGRKAHLLTPPKGEPEPMKAHAQGAISLITHEDTQQPGLYSVAAENAGPDGRIFYAISADRTESNLERLRTEDFTRLEAEIGAHHAPDWRALAHLIGLDAGGYEISEYLIMAAIALCFLETYLTRRWA